MGKPFEAFLAAFPPDGELSFPADADGLSRQVRDSYDVDVPSILVDFWRRAGWGYFGNRELYLFGGQLLPESRESLVRWNSHDYWRELFPPPAEGGPLFFAETCFGLQIGFRREAGTTIPCLLDLDCMEAHRAADSMEELFERILRERQALTDPELLAAVRSKVGPLVPPLHYAPLLSPLAGGSLTAENFHLETANVHLRTSVAHWKARRPQNEGPFPPS